jgi:hypothetical protein
MLLGSCQLLLGTCQMPQGGSTCQILPDATRRLPVSDTFQNEVQEVRVSVLVRVWGLGCLGYPQHAWLVGCLADCQWCSLEAMPVI